MAKLKRKSVDMARRLPYRDILPRILIVTEGEKSEPSYLHALRHAWRVSNVKLEIVSSSKGPNPHNVLESAIRIFENGDSSRNWERKSFDEIYLVFDNDRRDSEVEAVQKVAASTLLKNSRKERVPLHPIVSNPSFELWLLLHFQCQIHMCTQRELETKLKTHLVALCKDYSRSFRKLDPQTDVAIANAGVLRKNGSAIGAEYCFTAMDDLVRRLREFSVEQLGADRTAH